MWIPLIAVLAGVSPMESQMPRDAVTAGGLIYLSSTLPLDDRGALAGAGDIAAQTRAVLARARAALSAGPGADFGWPGTRQAAAGH